MHNQNKIKEVCGGLGRSIIHFVAKSQSIHLKADKSGN